MHKYFVVIAFLVLLVGCSNPLPPDKAQYVGVWSSENMELIIEAGGSVSYEKVSANSSKTINAPLKHFEGDDFVVGVLFFITTFKVSQAPAYIDGQWIMVVDGVKLIKVE